MRTVLVLNGPNLSRLGAREPDIYGSADTEHLRTSVQAWGRDLGLDVRWHQSDDEAELVQVLHGAADAVTDVVINPAAFTHYSYALRDAAAQVTDAGALLIEVHLSNPAAREAFRQISVIAGVASGTIAGFGADSYRLALHALADQANTLQGQGSNS